MADILITTLFSIGSVLLLGYVSYKAEEQQKARDNKKYPGAKHR